MKSILLIETPKSEEGEVPCKHCQMHVAEYDDYYHHYVCQSIRTNISADEWEIYKNCPLKALPEKRVYKDNYNRFSSQLAYEQGWNRVIEEITGEAEEIDARNKWWAEHSSRFD